MGHIASQSMIQILSSIAILRETASLLLSGINMFEQIEIVFAWEVC